MYLYIKMSAKIYYCVVQAARQEKLNLNYNFRYWHALLGSVVPYKAFIVNM